jgi:branched-chain amino acid transport system permease protein
MAVLRPSGDFDRSYKQDMGFLRKPWQWIVLLLSIAAVATSPYWGSSYIVTTLNRIGYTVIAVQGLNIITGYTGQISLGQSAFMLVGGYVSALIVTHLGLSTFIALPFAGLGAGIVGLIFGLPSLRVKGFYLAMATLAAQFIIPWMHSQNILADQTESSPPRYLKLAIMFLTSQKVISISRWWSW